MTTRNLFNSSVLLDELENDLGHYDDSGASEDEDSVGPISIFWKIRLLILVPITEHYTMRI